MLLGGDGLQRGGQPEAPALAVYQVGEVGVVLLGRYREQWPVAAQGALAQPSARRVLHRGGEVAAGELLVEHLAPRLRPQGLVVEVVGGEIGRG
ncbi:MAG: hypothetical protein AB1673_08075 [Actinomycetota bacterium]